MMVNKEGNISLIKIPTEETNVPTKKVPGCFISGGFLQWNGTVFGQRKSR